MSFIHFPKCCIPRNYKYQVRKSLGENWEQEGKSFSFPHWYHLGVFRVKFCISDKSDCSWKEFRDGWEPAYSSSLLSIYINRSKYNCSEGPLNALKTLYNSQSWVTLKPHKYILLSEMVTKKKVRFWEKQRLLLWFPSLAFLHGVLQDSKWQFNSLLSA